MKTQVIRINEKNIEQEILEAARLIREGELVAFPTETVYGLGGNALDPNAAQKIYAAKGRPSDNPLIVHISDVKDLEELTIGESEVAKKLAATFWPGPLTMILKKSDRVPKETTGGLDTVAIRMPNHPVALALIRESGCYIAAPSANTSGRPSPTRASHVEEDMQGRIPMILDGGEVGIGIESTIVDLSEEIPTILRPGFITPHMLEDVLGEVRMDVALLEVSGDAKPKAPGMKYRHYAPQGQLVIVQGEEDAVVSEIVRRTKEKTAEQKTVGILCSDETKVAYPQGVILSLGSRKNNTEIAQHLFDALRKFDEEKVDFIYSESFDSPGLGMAIMNRLLKAAGHQVIRV